MISFGNRFYEINSPRCSYNLSLFRNMSSHFHQKTFHHHYSNLLQHLDVEHMFLMRPCNLSNHIVPQSYNTSLFLIMFECLNRLFFNTRRNDDPCTKPLFSCKIRHPATFTRNHIKNNNFILFL